MKRLMIYCMLFLTVAACDKKDSNCELASTQTCEGEIITKEAVILRNTFIDANQYGECSFLVSYERIGEDNPHEVLATNLPECFKVEGLKVKISFCELDIPSSCGFGAIGAIELKSIQKI